MAAVPSWLPPDVEELFKYRTGLDKTVPQRGGTKDFMPDGSWLQGKRLEKFHQEREAVLSEPRVQRIADLVKGEWNPAQQLVELEKEMRNFWEHMGFVDKKRKWLFPEEALFLMETNVLEVWYKGMPISIQQAFAMFTGMRFPLEHYQVYSHLRRIGYVVLRHQQRLSITKYERKIRLDKYVSKKDRKRRVKEEKKMSELDVESQGCSPAKKVNLDSSSDQMEFLDIKKDPILETDMSKDGGSEAENMDYEVDIQKTENKVADTDLQHTEQAFEDQNVENRKTDQCVSDVRDMKSIYNEQGRVEVETIEALQYNLSNKGKVPEHIRLQDTGKSFQEKQDASTDTIHLTENSFLSAATTDQVQNDEDNNHSTRLSKLVSDLSVWKIQRTSQKLNHTDWNFDEINLPNLAISFEQGGTIDIKRPEKRFLPGNFDLAQDIYSYNSKEMLNKKSFRPYFNEEPGLFDDSHEFSYPEYLTGSQKVKKSCKNWHEYKTLQWKADESWDRSHDFPHLYGDKVKPLVLPEDATSTGAILDKLHVIQEELNRPNSGILQQTPAFDIYAPNMKFKKSSPGKPDHRVFVAKCSDPFPNLLQVAQGTQHLQDDVPLLWAVVDSGDIAFYEVTDLLLPVDITMG